jgi:hypothetical protein
MARLTAVDATAIVILSRLFILAESTIVAVNIVLGCFLIFVESLIIDHIILPICA